MSMDVCILSVKHIFKVTAEVALKLLGCDLQLIGQIMKKKKFLNLILAKDVHRVSLLTMSMNI